MSRVGINVGLKLNSQQFSQGLDRANARMRAFGQNMKRQQETVGRMGLGGLGRGFGIGGGLVEALSMGGMAGGIAAVAAPIAAIAGMLRLFEGMNEFRRSAVESMDKFNKDLRLGKINQIVTDQQSAFAILAAEQKAVAGPGVFDTFQQSMAATSGGQGFFEGAKGAAGAAGNIVGQIMEDPSKLLGLNLLGMLGVLPTVNLDEATAAFDAGTAQNTAQAQAATEAMKEARKQRSVAASLLEDPSKLLGLNLLGMLGVLPKVSPDEAIKESREQRSVSLMEDPSKLLGLNSLNMLGVLPKVSPDEATAAFDAGTAQNTAQAQASTEAIKEAREQRSVSLLERIVELLS